MSRRHSRVPKFGSWDADNIQFSGDFETARKERAAAVGMNPIDQQGNPEAIVPGREGHGNGVHVDSVETLYPSQNQLANSDKSEPGEKKPHSEGLGNGKDNSSRRSLGSASAGSDKSIPSGYPPLQQQNSRRTRSSRKNSKKNLTEFNSFATTPSPVSGTLRSASNASDDKDRYINRLASASPSVPKFGAWEEMDTSEGYTVIFDKVKEEKQNASTKFTATAASPKPPNSVKFYQTKRSRKKMFCCLF